MEIIKTDVLEGLSKLESSSIDLIVTSPPYNLSIGYAASNDSYLT